jgi:polyferredoxin
MIGTQNYSGSEIIFYFITYYIVLLVIAVLHFTLGQRGFCHTGCWMAPFMILGTKVRNGLGLPGFRLKSTSENCTSCKKCNKTCPMGLDVMNMVKQNQLSDVECIMCLNCVDTCKRSAIDFGFGFPKFQIENKEAIPLQVRN